MKTTLTIEESARLIELGVDAKLASKCRVQHEADFEVEYRIVPHDEFCYEMASLNPQPIFDLSDILSILPKEIIINGKTENLNIVMDNYGALVGYPIFHETHGAAFVKPELIDALYQLLIWAITNNYVKTEKR